MDAEHEVTERLRALPRGAPPAFDALMARPRRGAPAAERRTLGIAAVAVGLLVAASASLTRAASDELGAALARVAGRQLERLVAGLERHPIAPPEREQER